MRDEPLGEGRGPEHATTGLGTAFVFLRFLSHLLNVSGKWNWPSLPCA